MKKANIGNQKVHKRKENCLVNCILTVQCLPLMLLIVHDARNRSLLQPSGIRQRMRIGSVNGEEKGVI